MRNYLLVLLMFSFGLVVSAASAQTTSRLLQPDQPISGVIDNQHLTQTYVFTTHSPYTVNANISNTGAIPLEVFVVDTGGQTVVDVGQIAAGTGGGFGHWSGDADGTYYLMIIAAEAPAGRQGLFTVTFTTDETVATSAPTPAPAGNSALQLILTWRDGARLSLEVREPNGGDLHWRSPQSTDGGSFFGSTEAIDCASFTPHTQTQTISWPPTSNLPSGSYEILVHYIDGCASDVPFTLDTRFEGQTYPALTGTMKADQTYVTGFVVSVVSGGNFTGNSAYVTANAGLPISLAQLLDAVQTLSADGTAVGSITNSVPFAVFSFEGRLGQVISATLTRTSDSNLDTYLALMDSNGNLLATNDDRADGVTDSALENVRLRHNGTYLVVVTRYGQLAGATEGNFALTVTGVGD